jgi:hypothetical protein
MKERESVYVREREREGDNCNIHDLIKGDIENDLINQMIMFKYFQPSRLCVMNPSFHNSLKQFPQPYFP